MPGNGSTITASTTDLRERIEAPTGQDNSIQIQPVEVHVLEMEDVLFHHNSAVMMPARPSGRSAADGTQDDATAPDDQARGDAQDQISGLAVLAVTFKQFEFDPRKRLLITGHADTSGQAAYNFELSGKRAMGVLYLLEGNRLERHPTLWSRLCAQQHVLEDTQQIMQYFARSAHWQWPCDPEQIDNTWGQKTDRATRAFFQSYTAHVQNHPADTLGWPVLPENLHLRVKNHEQHKWPEEAWLAVYELYNVELARALRITPGELDGIRRSRLRWVDDTKKTLGCGESFPVDDLGRDNYRSQQNRRVELLFFDEDEVPTLDCPARTSSVHTPAECPIWHQQHLRAIYIDPADLTAVAYHLKFVFFDPVTQALRPVPDGLRFHALEDADQEIPVRASYSGGVYTLKVEDRAERTALNFTFETDRPWLHIADDSSEPVALQTANPDTFNPPDDPVQRLKYYRLPSEWASRNYWTRFDNDMAKGDRFEVVMRDRKRLKPYGDSLTAPDAPLVISLDDIVLGDPASGQNIRDLGPGGAPLTPPLDANSRFALFYIDRTTQETVEGVQKNLRRLKLHNPDADQPVFSAQAFTSNLIHDVPGNAKIVYFCNRFHPVAFRRSRRTDAQFDLARGHVLGARLALADDPQVHVGKSVINSNAQDLANAYALTGCGNYELHYFHGLDELDGKLLSYLLVYWSTRFTTQNVDHNGNARVPGDANDVTNHRKFGMVNAMTRLNKDYLIVKSSGSKDFAIRPYHYMEAKNDTNGGAHKAQTNIVKDQNNPGAFMTTTYAQFRDRDYQSDPTYLGNPDPINSMQDVDGSTYTVLTNHHEMGHATGNWDEYLYTYNATPGNWFGLSRYDQPFTAIGGPYSCDELSRMYHNRTARLRNFWKFVCWLHDDGLATRPLHPFLDGTRFKITFKGTSHLHQFELPDAQRNVALAAHRSLSQQLAPGHKVDLLLYRLGDDELSRLLRAGTVFHAILTIRVRLAVQFRAGDDGTAWPANQKRPWAVALTNRIQGMLDNKFKICATTADDFQNVFVICRPAFKEISGAAPGDSQYDIVVKWQLGTAYAAAGKDVAADWDLSAANTIVPRIARHCFGQTAGTGDLTKAELAPIVQWVRTTRGNPSFQIEDL